MSAVSKAIQGIQRAVLLLAAVALAALPLMTAYDVTMRYVFHAPTAWATELSIYLLQFIVFVIPGALLIDGDHLRVTFWIENRTGLTRRIAEAVTALVILPYALILIWYGWNYTVRAFDRGMLSPTLLQVPLWIVYALIPIGGVLLVLGIALRCASSIAGEYKSGTQA